MRQSDSFHSSHIFLIYYEKVVFILNLASAKV
jgi:hypothetical protein